MNTDKRVAPQFIEHQETPTENAETLRTQRRRELSLNAEHAEVRRELNVSNNVRAEPRRTEIPIKTTLNFTRAAIKVNLSSRPICKSNRRFE